MGGEAVTRYIGAHTIDKQNPVGGRYVVTEPLGIASADAAAWLAGART